MSIIIIEENVKNSAEQTLEEFLKEISPCEVQKNGSKTHVRRADFNTEYDIVLDSRNKILRVVEREEEQVSRINVYYQGLLSRRVEIRGGLRRTLYFIGEKELEELDWDRNIVLRRINTIYFPKHEEHSYASLINHLEKKKILSFIKKSGLKDIIVESDYSLNNFLGEYFVSAAHCIKHMCMVKRLFYAHYYFREGDFYKEEFKCKSKGSFIPWEDAKKLKKISIERVPEEVKDLFGFVVGSEPKEKVSNTFRAVGLIKSRYSSLKKRIARFFEERESTDRWAFLKKRKD